MKTLLITLAMTATLTVLSSSAYAPTETQSFGGLKKCFGRVHLVSISNSLIYCSQTGTIFQDASDLINRGLLKTQLLSQNF